VLPFPARDEHKRRYVRELAPIVRNLREQGVFLESAAPPAEERRFGLFRRSR